MKFKVLPTVLSLLMTFGLFSCGKKARDHNSTQPESVIESSETDVSEETHKDLYEAILVNDLAKISLLLSKKSQVDLNTIMDNGETLMTTAVAKDLYSIVELLLDNNASLFRTNNKKETPLMVAAKKGLENQVRLLISLGSTTDAKDTNGNTALHLAILNNHETVALYLINSRANIDITNNDNQTALKLAEILNLKKVLNLLRSLTQSSVGLPTKVDLINLITLGDHESIRQLLDKYPTIIHEYKDLNYYVLVMNHHPHDVALSITHLLIIYGVRLTGPAIAEITPLIEAVKRNYEDFVSIMLKDNVNPNVLDAQGNSALIWAIKRNNPTMVKMLLEKNALEKYTYFENGKKLTMKACTTVKEMKSLSTGSEEKKANEDIQDLLGCGLSWLF